MSKRPTPQPIAGFPGYLSSDQVMQLLGISRASLHRAVRENELKAVRIAGRLLFPVHALPGAELEPPRKRSLQLIGDPNAP